jgi:hypothetical protein
VASELHEIEGGAGTFDEEIDILGSRDLLLKGLNLLATYAGRPSDLRKWLHGALTSLVALPSFMTAFTVAASLEYAGRARGGRGLFGWWARLPYFDPDRFLFAYFFAGLVLFFFRRYHRHRERVGGGVHLAAVIEAHDEERAGYTRALHLLETRPDVKGIYVITKDGRCLFEMSFKDILIDVDLITSALSAVGSLIRESIHTQKRLKTIDHEDVKILIEYGASVNAAVIADKETLMSANGALTESGEISAVM